MSTLEKNRDPISPSFLFFAIAFLGALYALQMKVTIFDEPYLAKFIDPNTGVEIVADPKLGLIESIVSGPIRLEFNFKSCKNSNVVRLFVGTHGIDSTSRLPAQWKILTKGESGDWRPSGADLTSSGFKNGHWYSYPIQSPSCIKDMAFDVNSITGSNILRIYQVQLYKLPFAAEFSPTFDVVASSLTGFFGLITKLLLPIPFDPAMLMALVAVFSFDIGIRGWRDSMFYRVLIARSASTNRDIVCTLLSIFGLLAIATTIFSFGIDFLTKYIKPVVAGWVGVNSVAINTGSALVDVFLLLLIITFFDYWLHRIVHMNRFWPLHRFHHSATEFNGITVFRNNPALFAFEPIIKLWPAVLFPVAPHLSAYWGTALFLFWFHQVVTHSNVDWSFGWLGRWLLVSPALHKIHHSSNPDHYNKNYGNLFIIWDRIFGTYLSLPSQTIVLGTSPEDEYMNRKWVFEEWALDTINLIRLVLRLKRAADNDSIFNAIRRPG